MLLFLSKQLLRFCALTVFTLVIVLALLTGVLRLGLPYAASYKNEIQAWVGNYLRAPVELGSMELEWSGFSPSLKLSEIAIEREGDRRIEVSLEEIWLDLNLYKSLFTGKLQITEVTLAGADLVLEYVGRQQFKITSYGLASNEDGVENKSSLDVASWLMSSGQVGLLDSRVRLIDKARGIDYQIDNLNVSADNTTSLHRLRIAMDLPPQLGSSMEIELDLSGSSNAIERSVGNFYASAKGMNIENWMRIWPQRTVELSGTGNVEFWGSWGENQLLSVRGRLNSPELNVLSNAKENQPAINAAGETFSQVSTDLFWQRAANGWRTEIDFLRFKHSGITNVLRSGLIASENDDQRFVLSAEGDSLSIEPIAGLLKELDATPALSKVSAFARDANAQGELRDWRIGAELNAGQQPQLSVQAQLAAVSTSPVGAVPGIKNVNAKVDLSDNTGQVKIDAIDLGVELPLVFSKALQIENSSAVLSVDLNDRSAMLSSDNLLLRNQGLDLLSSFSLGLDVDNDWHVDLQAAAELDEITKANAYLPDKVMRGPLKKWLNNALLGGQVNSSTLLLHGKLKDFPYVNKAGLFRAEVAVENAEMKFLPNWPAGSELDGSVIFEGAGMRFSVDRGKVAGTTLSRLDGEIANFKSATLALSGANRGSLQSFVDFSNEGPLKKILSPALQDARGSGDVVLNLALSVPLQAREKRSVNDKLAVDGTVFFAENSLSLERFDVALEQLVGGVSFTESDLQINNLSANYLGSPVKIRAQSTATEHGTESVIKVSGLLQADKVMSHYDIPVHGFFKGVSKWDVALAIPLAQKTASAASRRGVRLTATSDLLGTQVSLPAPMNKSSALKKPVVVEGQFNNNGEQRWRVENDLARLLIKAQADKGMQSLDIHLGDGDFKPQESEGIHIAGKANAVAFDGWITAVNQIIDTLPKTDAAPSPILPVFANVDAEQLIVGVEEMGKAKLRVNTDTQYVNSVIDSPHLRGSIRIPRAHWDRDQSIKARIAYADSIFLDALKTGGETGVPAPPLDPMLLPRIDAHVTRFVYHSLTLRNLGLRAEPDAAGLKITALGYANENSQLIGEGYWHVNDPQELNASGRESQVTRLTFNLQSNNIGETFVQAGYTGVMAEGEGSATFNLSWPGPVYKPDVETLRGDVSLYAKDGRILSIDPGAARLVGLIALQEIPRRLSLDFRDLVKGGLDYKRISGNLVLGDGLGRAEVLRLEGGIGVVEIQGDIDLVAQTFDQRIRVLPRVSAALPIIGILSGGASAGIGALLVTPVLKAFGIDIDRIGLTEYTLTGKWAEPKIESLSRPRPKPPSGNTN